MNRSGFCCAHARPQQHLHNRLGRLFAAGYMCLLGVTAMADASANEAQKPTPNKPNIVIILADDLGFGDVSYYNEHIVNQKAHVQTPAIDELANRGMWFTDAHSPTSLCSPSRYAIMTGNYTYRSRQPWGVWGSFNPPVITAEDATLGRVAKAAGYRTGFIGKWHLGGNFQRADSDKIFRVSPQNGITENSDLTSIVKLKNWASGNPRTAGYDYDFTLPTGVQGPVYLAYENSTWYPLTPKSNIIHLNEKSVQDAVFLSDKGPGVGDSAWNPADIYELLADKAATFITQSAKESKPFLLTYWTPAVHLPHTPPAEIDGQKIRGTTPSYHLDQVRVLDYEVKTIVAALKASGQLDNTLIIFTSDNGGLKDSKAAAVGHSSPGQLRGAKALSWEGGHRVPFIVFWPGKVKPASINNNLINGTDIVATIADALGQSLNDKQAVDSMSFLSQIDSSAPKNTVRQSTYLQSSGARAEVIYRKGEWKLIMATNRGFTKFTPVELYNLEKNPLELSEQNLVNQPQYHELCTRLLHEYMAQHTSGKRTRDL